METKEQKIERLKKEIEDWKEFLKDIKIRALTSFEVFDDIEEIIKQREQQLKELEDE